mgnify:CR=1 FL=1
MAKKTSQAAPAKPSKTLPSSNDPKADCLPDRAALIDAIETERQRIFRARAVTQVVAKLLHDLCVLENDEPDIGFALDVVAGMLEHSLAGLDRITLDNL